MPILLDLYWFFPYIILDVDVDEDGLLFIEEIDESAKIEAMNDIEEEYESETVSDYMNYGV